MIKIHMLMLSAVFSSLIAPLVAHADSKPDPLQTYRAEIKRMEANASQSVLDQLKSNESNSDLSPLPSQSASTPIPHSPLTNNDAAFSIPATSQNEALANKKNKPANNNNPWLKPNPWEAQAHVNPWANAPIPSGGYTTDSTHTVTPQPGPPNIFAPPHSAVNTPNKKTNSPTNH